MRALGLYSKMLLSFLGLLLLVQVLVIGSFVLFEGPPPHHQMDSHLLALSLLSQKVAQDGLAEGLAKGQPLPQVLEGLCRELAGMLPGQVWFQAGGRTLAQSFPGPLPEGVMAGLEAGGMAQGAFRFMPHPPREMVVEAPLTAPGLAEAKLILLLVHPPNQPPSHYFFLARLALICLLVALLVIPVSRFIARPIKRLCASALKIAEGDLDHRARVDAQDEIGELARSFNYMTDRLQQMVLASRELLAYVSHELRSPLARIVVAGQMLGDRLEGQATDDAARYLGAMQEDIQQMDALLARILLLSRLDMRQAAPRRELVDLAELLRQQADKWSSLLEHRRLELVMDLAAEAWLLADGEALATVFANLLENAAKHAKAPGRVTVRLAAEKGGWRVRLGNPADPLDPAELEAIFQPFHRAVGAQAAGSGLGLALARKIVQAHGGRIVARHQPPELVVEVSLPGLVPPAAAQPRTESNKTTPGISTG
ncbi:MAG: HAMP domain-containing sensor histidine kinase [Pseudomonadota bacterium]